MWLNRDKKSIKHLLEQIPKTFELDGNNHKFFYNKGAYLLKRFEGLRYEMDSRGLHFDFRFKF